MDYCDNNNKIGKYLFNNYCNFVFSNYLIKKKIRKIPLIYKYSILLIDSRKDPNLKFIIYNSLFFTDESVGLQIFCTKNNHSYIMDIVKDITNVSITLINVPLNNIKDYNNILTNYHFWKHIKGEYCLIIQPDSILVKKLDFTKYSYDFIGAPFSKDNKILYSYETGKEQNIILKLDLPNINNAFPNNQNGGLSIRNISKMKEICKNYPYKNLKSIFKSYNEDTYFCYYLNKLNYNLPSYEISSKFSTEQVFNKDSIGFHKMWLYNKLDKMYFLLQKNYENILTNL